jgi:hypothetical protein
MPVVQTGFSIYAAPNPLVPLIQSSQTLEESQFASIVPPQPRFSLFLRPHYLTAIYQLAEMYSWSNLIYLYDSDQGLHKLQFLLSLLNDANELIDPKRSATSDEKPTQRMQLKALKRISDGRQGYEFIRQFELQDKESIKHVILDCELPLVRQLIVHHVNDIYMGRRNYHYLLSSLVFDHIVQFGSHTPEFFALNITGIRLLDPEYLQTVISLPFNLSTLASPAATSGSSSSAPSMVHSELLAYQLSSWHESALARSGLNVSFPPRPLPNSPKGKFVMMTALKYLPVLNNDSEK